ncbi:hypothetical protein K438DRAFT_842229 [Mycena galopus ATCC 62051]|nr:hypothetical protein K438DRAFT_842229 [Mycena galopus ATCC 62051]
MFDRARRNISQGRAHRTTLCRPFYRSDCSERGGCAHIERCFSPAPRLDQACVILLHCTLEFKRMGRLPQFEGSHRDAARAAEVLFTNSTSMVLTLLGAMEETIPDLQMRSQLCIHIVAAEKELTTQDMMEKLLHHPPKLQKLIIICIGPASVSRRISQSLPADKVGNSERPLYGPPPSTTLRIRQSIARTLPPPTSSRASTLA